MATWWIRCCDNNTVELKVCLNFINERDFTILVLIYNQLYWPQIITDLRKFDLSNWTRESLSTLRVKLTQHWESNWLNIESLIDSTLRVKLTQNWESNWLKYSPVTHFARSNYSSASDSTFNVKMTQFFSLYSIIKTTPKFLALISRELVNSKA